MSRYVISIVTTMLVLGMFAGIAVGNLPIPIPSQVPVIKEGNVPAMPFGDFQAVNFTKLEISPRYGSLRLQPGESREITVTIKNKEKKAVSVKPNIVVPPYGEFIMGEEWISVTPDSAEIPAGGSQKFTVKLSVPRDASVGYYSAQIAFTDEVLPTPTLYPPPFPNYVHSFSLSIEVWAPPKIQITPTYISGQLEAGKEYDYEIKVKNTGKNAISISPRVGSDMPYGPYGIMAPTLTEDDITITAPNSIPAGGTVIVRVHIKVPAEARGWYNGYIDLGIDDPSVKEWERRVSLNFIIWKQTIEPFIKRFTLKEKGPITIEISSSYFGMIPIGAWIAKEPSFEVSLEDPAGKKVELKIVKKVIKGSVSMGGEIPPWEIESAGIYREMGTQYMETYTAMGSPGEWKLEVIPRNTIGFEYTITIGG